MDSLKNLVEKIKESSITVLVKDGVPLGYRVKIFNVSCNKFLYYDFEESLAESLNSIKGKLKSEKLVSRNQRLYTEDELKGEYEATELSSKKDVDAILKRMLLMYKLLGRG